MHVREQPADPEIVPDSAPSAQHSSRHRRATRLDQHTLHAGVGDASRRPQSLWLRQGLFHLRARRLRSRAPRHGQALSRPMRVWATRAAIQFTVRSSRPTEHGRPLGAVGPSSSGAGVRAWYRAFKRADRLTSSAHCSDRSDQPVGATGHERPMATTRMGYRKTQIIQYKRRP